MFSGGRTLVDRLEACGLTPSAAAAAWSLPRFVQMIQGVLFFSSGGYLAPNS